jgi:hypothetical protein
MVGEKMRALDTGLVKAMGMKKYPFIASPAAVILCLIIILLMRTI